MEIKQSSENCNVAQGFRITCQSLFSFKVRKENSVFIKAAVTIIRRTADRNGLIIHGLWTMLVLDNGWMGSSIHFLSLSPTSAT